MALTNQYELAKDATFLTRVHQAMVTASLAAANSPHFLPLGANHAATLLVDQAEFLDDFAQVLTADPAITSRSTDAELLARAALVLPAFLMGV